METNVTFLSVCLDNSRCILQRKKFYSRELEYIKTTFDLCRIAYLEDPTSKKHIELYSKLLEVQQFMLQRMSQCSQ